MTEQELDSTSRSRAVRAAVSLGALAVFGVAGFAVGRAVPSSSANDPVRAVLRLAEDDNGKLFLGDASVSDAYGVDRVVRSAPDAFFDALPPDCASAFAQMTSVAAAYESFAAASEAAKAVWGQAVLVAQNVCTFDGYTARFSVELAAWSAAGAPNAGQRPAPVDPAPPAPPTSDTTPAASEPVSSTDPAAARNDTSIPASSTVAAPPDTAPAG